MVCRTTPGNKCTTRSGNCVRSRREGGVARSCTYPAFGIELEGLDAVNQTMARETRSQLISGKEGSIVVIYPRALLYNSVKLILRIHG